MPQLVADVLADRGRDDVIPGEFRINVTFTNRSGEPARLNVHQAAHPALVLDVRDDTGRAVLLAPPSAPDSRDLEPGEQIAPGQAVTLAYAGFLDRSLPSGTYRIRYFGEHPALGGSMGDPLASDWMVLTVRRVRGFVPGERIPGIGKPAPDDWRPEPKPPWQVVLGPIRILFRLWWCWIVCVILRWRGVRCDRVLTQEFDEPRTETISNAPAGSEAWNGTYGWRARFLMSVEEPQSRVRATIRVRLVGTITAAQRAAWEAAIEAVWNNRFKLCDGCWCCFPDGAECVCDIQFVSSGEHQVVNVGTSTTNMGNWGANDTIDISHEFGHMLGALDEYFTVNGIAWGAGRQPTGDIMNNPANPPAARHYETIRAASASLVGRTLTTIARDTPCP